MAVDIDTRAHALQLADMHKAVFKDIFADDTAPCRQSHQRHELRLHIGGKPGVRACTNVNGQNFTRPAHPYSIRFDVHLHPGVLQVGKQGLLMIGAQAFNPHIAAGHGGGNQESPCLDAIGHDFVAHGPEFGDAFDLESFTARPFDARPHGDQRFGQVDDLRLAGGIFDHGRAFGECCRHHKIFGSTHRRNVKADAGALEGAGAGLDITVIEIDFRPKSFKPLEVQIDGARANGASPGETHAGMAAAGQQGAENQNRGAHGTHQFIRGLNAFNMTCVDGKGAVFTHHIGAQDRQQLFGRIDIAQPGHVADMVNAGSQQCGKQQRQS